jgi:adenosylhomocysteine nucleosidase
VAIDRFQPEQVLFTGIAGGIDENLNPGDLVIGEKVFQHDLGFLGNEGFRLESEKNPMDGKRNPIYFESSPELIALAKASTENIKLAPAHDAIPKITSGLIATGDVFMASDAKRAEFQRMGVKAVEMEGAAVAQVCYQHKVPFIVIRSLSDKADASAKTDIKTFYMTAAANSATLVAEMARRLALQEAKK